MRIKKERIRSVDFISDELEAIRQEGEDFWGSVRELLRYGIPSRDQRGHWSELRVKIRPIQADIIAGIRERMPEGWYKNQGSLYRSIIAVGCKAIFKFLDNEKSQWHEVLVGLGQISKQQRLEEFQVDMKNLKGKILSGSMPPNEKVKVVDLISRLEKKVVGE